MFRVYCPKTGRTLLVLSLLLYGSAALASGQAVSLTLPEAEKLALGADPTIKRFQAKAAAMDEQAVAAGQLPDPQLKVAMLNLPVNTFSRSSQAMTQLQVGLQQAFPRGHSRSIMTHRKQALAEADRSQAQTQKSTALQSVRDSWLDLYYWIQADRVVADMRPLFAQLVQITRFEYSTGHRNQQDVLRAQLELSRLVDRATRIVAARDAARAQLAEWVGQPAARRPLPDALPALKALPAREALEKQLSTHPEVRTQDALVEAGQRGVDLALAQYKPGWRVDVSYGLRSGNDPSGADRPDFFSAMVYVDLPIFTGKRQDQGLAAARHREQAARFARDDRLRALRSMLDGAYARWDRLNERVHLYDRRILPESVQNAKVSLEAYQNDDADFTTLMRAAIAELETRLEALRVRVDRAKAHVKLLYLAGETS